MAGEKHFTRIPPASTGNRITIRHSAAVPYISRIGTFIRGMQVSFGTSGFSAHVSHLEEANSTSGTLFLTYEERAIFNNLQPLQGETITDENGVVLATVGTGAYDVYTNTTHITSYDNTFNGLKIDQAGSANIRFSEGVPQLDAFGKLRVSGATLLGEYVFANGTLPQAISTTEIGAGVTTWDSVIRALQLQTSSASGDIARATSDTYHHYVAGSSHLFIATLALSDSGKTNLVRDWGLFDENNGVFFRLNGSTLSAVIRADVSGSVVNNVIPRTEWNVDRLDGTGPSGMVIDVTKDNLYFIDAQWLGAGRVRFGVYHNGARVVCHEYNHNNRYPYPYSATMSLPVRFTQENTGAVGSTSEMRVFCAAVWTETDVDLTTLGSPGLQSTLTELTTVDQETYIATITAPEFFDNGKSNRSIYWPTESEFIAWDSVTGSGAPVEIVIYANPVLSNLNFQAGETTVLIDTAGTWFGAGIPVYKSYVQGHVHNNMSSIFNGLPSALKNYADNGGTQTTQILTMSNSSPATISVPLIRMVREGQAMTIRNCAGMTEANGQVVYAKITSLTTAELYTDVGLTTPFDTTLYGDYTAGSGELYGQFGSRFYLTLTARKLFGANPVKVKSRIAWKEITQ